MSAVTHNDALNADPSARVDVRVTLADMYELLLPVTGWYCLFSVPRKEHWWTTSKEKLVYKTQCTNHEADWYFAVGSFSEQRRKQEFCVAKRCFYLDFDAGDKKYGRDPEGTYPTFQAARDALYAFIRATGLTPTFIISSGEGLHVYWALDADATPEEWQPVARALGVFAASLRLKVDRSCTTDSARVLRPIGALHNNGKHVTSLFKRVGPVWNLAEFAKRVTGPEVETSGQIPTRARLAIADDLLPRRGGTADPAMVESALLFLAADCSYDVWMRLCFAVLSELGLEAGFELLDRWSQTAPHRYDADALRTLCNSYKERADGVTVGTLFDMAIKAGWKRLAVVSPGSEAQNAEGAPQSEETDNADAYPTDLWLGRVFVRWSGKVFCFDHAAKNWMMFRVGAWIRCGKGEQQEAFKHLSGRLLEQAGKVQAAGNGDGAKKLIACATRAQSAHGIEAALKLAASDPKLAVRTNEFDRDPDLFNAANGVIHLPTRELRPHDPAQMLSRQSPVVYDAGADCPRFDRFLVEITLDRADLIENLQRICGYTLSGHVSAEKLFFMLGIGANGKSVLANLMRRILGTYAVVVPSAFLMRSQRDGGGATPELAMVAGARLVLANEVEAGAMLSAQMVKVAVSTEAITARALYGAPFTFAPTHKLWVRGNHKPIIRDNDEGIWRRIDLIPFDRNFTADERDGGLEEQLMAEASGILAWMVRGFAKWRSDGLRPARCVTDASNAYRADSDLLGQWVNDCCVVDPVGRAAQHQAYSSYRLWCIDQGVHPTSKHSFTRGLKEHGIGEARDGGGTRQKIYTGLRLAP